jgi:hypothetical protein
VKTIIENISGNSKLFRVPIPKNRYKYLYAERKQIKIPVFQNDHLSACNQCADETILHRQIFKQLTTA